MSKDIKAIITFLDNFLTRTGRPNIDPVEANSILAKAGLLNDNKDRPGKPLRDLLRKGFLPHAFQSGGKGTLWIIPRSSKHNFKIAPRVSFNIKVERPKDEVIKKSVSKLDISQLDKVLMAERNFKNANSVDSLIPHEAGLYCIRVRNINSLPKPFNTYLTDNHHNIVYIGIATRNLNKRFLNQELRAKGHGTFFRSIGAILGHRPPKGSLKNKANKRNYRFSPTDEQKIIKWINDNLQVNWVEFSGDFKSLETELIIKYRSLINIAKNPSALLLLSDLRKECVQIANES